MKYDVMYEFTYHEINDLIAIANNFEGEWGDPSIDHVIKKCKLMYEELLSGVKIGIKIRK
jgi:hypothetical protein